MQTVWGWVHLGEGTRAVYYIRWTAGKPDHGMVWFLSVGRWDEHGVATERRSVGLRCRLLDGRPQFMVIDAATTPWGVQGKPELGALLTREEAHGTELVHEVFGYVNEILIRDPRVELFVRTGEGVVPEERPSGS